MRVLRLGSIGPSVQLLQLALNRAGFGPLEQDGIFGTATQNALARFQLSRGLTPDGIAGSATHRALLPFCPGIPALRSIGCSGATVFIPLPKDMAAVWRLSSWQTLRCPRKILFPARSWSSLFPFLWYQRTSLTPRSWWPTV